MQIEAYHEKVADALIAAVEAGTAPWMKPWAPGESCRPMNFVTGRHYQGINPIMLMARGYGDPRWIGFAQAKGKGASVRKGQKGTPILRVLPPRTLTDKAGLPMLDDDGNERTGRPMVKVLHVWHVSQVDGLELPALGQPTTDNTWEACELAEAAMTGAGVPVDHIRGDRACYSPDDDRIRLPERDQFPEALGYYHTALHELGHATGHSSRLSRHGTGTWAAFGNQRYAREELVAEITAMMAGAELGTGSTPQHGAAYVANWLQALKNDTKEIIKAAAAAQKAATWIVAHTAARHAAAA